MRYDISQLVDTLTNLHFFFQILFLLHTHMGNTDRHQCRFFSGFWFGDEHYKLCTFKALKQFMDDTMNAKQQNYQPLFARNIPYYIEIVHSQQNMLPKARNKKGALIRFLRSLSWKEIDERDLWRTVNTFVRFYLDLDLFNVPCEALGVPAQQDEGAPYHHSLVGKILHDTLHPSSRQSFSLLSKFHCRQTKIAFKNEKPFSCCKQSLMSRILVPMPTFLPSTFEFRFISSGKIFP